MRCLPVLGLMPFVIGTFACSAPCEPSGEHPLFATLARTEDAGMCPETLRGTILFTSGAARLSLDDGSTGECTTGYSDDRGAPIASCQFDFSCPNVCTEAGACHSVSGFSLFRPDEVVMYGADDSLVLSSGSCRGNYLWSVAL